MKTKIYTSLVLGIMFLAGWQSHAQNVLTDGDFSSTAVITPYTTGVGPANIWSSFQNVGIDANATIDAGICKYQITNGGSNTWEVQLVQWGFPLILGDYYRLTFDCKADADRFFGVYLGEDGGSWTSIIGYENYSQYASTNWQTISIDFQVTSVFDYYKFSFEIGGSNAGMYFDNIVLTDLGPYPSIGIIGSAVNGWDTDVDMQTTDGIHYTLSNYPLTNGEAKFRQSNNWNINWGNTSFPGGIAFLYGPNMLITGFGNFDITFNRETGEYLFSCVSNCPANIGIIGSAVSPDYETGPDINMSTTDGVNYYIKSYTLTNGEAKFRKDDSWDINWGNTAFPLGTASLDGPAILVNEGNYDIKFNIQTLKYSFTAPSIGILGSALSGWDIDIVMQTTDGINYTLGEYPFNDGAVKFRTDNSWDINWGGYSFPTGWAYLNGPDIYVLAGTYKVAFNRITGEYSFTATTCPIAGIQCPYDQYWYSSPGVCGTNVYYQPVTAAPNCGGEGVSVVQIAGLPSGSIFPVGTTINKFVLTNASGNTDTCSFNVFVFDWEPPVITGIDTHIVSLWPPNKKMIGLKLDYKSSDNCGVVNCELSVSSNEPADADDEHENHVNQPDWIIVDKHHVLLKADREGPGNGREYTITITCTDGSYNTTIQQVIVKIPHDNRKGPQNKKDGDVSCTIEIVNQVNGTSVAKSQNINANAGTVNLFEDLPFKANIYPNPVKDILNVEIGNAKTAEVNLVVADAYGRAVINKVIEQPDSGINRFQLSTSDLPSGIYILKLTNGSESTTARFVK